MVWFGEIERKLSKLSKTTFVLPLNYFICLAYSIVFLTTPSVQNTHGVLCERREHGLWGELDHGQVLAPVRRMKVDTDVEERRASILQQFLEKQLKWIKVFLLYYFIDEWQRHMRIFLNTAQSWAVRI
jgi:hypothetical protein